MMAFFAETISRICPHKWIVIRENRLHDPWDPAMQTGTWQTHQCRYCKTIRDSEPITAGRAFRHGT